jgi:hypothetical protein
MSPEEVAQHISDLKTGDPRQGAAVRIEEARLSQRAAQAGKIADANPGNEAMRLQAKTALNDVTRFHNEVVAPMKNNWHAMGMSLQDEVPVDLTNYAGQYENWLRDNGEAPPANMEPSLRKMAAKTKAVVDAEQVARANSGKEINAAAAKKGIPSAEEVRQYVMKKMQDLPCRT